MNRDTLKTLAGLVVIGFIVVATFLYGNAQRQSQNKHDQEVKQQANTNPSASPAKSAAIAAQPKASTQPGTAAVASPSSNAVQGGKVQASTAPSATTSPKASPTPSATPSPTTSPTPSATPKATATPTPAPTPAPTATPVAGQVAGAATPSMPQTGTEQIGLLGVTAMVITYLGLLRSRRSIVATARSHR